MPIRRNFWRIANARNKEQRIYNYKIIPADEAFWRAWKDNPKAMLEAGYTPVKTGGGWEVRIAIK